jgi:hypothetical protein
MIASVNSNKIDGDRCFIVVCYSQGQSMGEYEKGTYQR